MKKKTLYEYVVLFHDEKIGTQIIVEPTYELAYTSDEVKILAGREIDEKYLSSFDQVEVIVRPFR